VSRTTLYQYIKHGISSPTTVWKHHDCWPVWPAAKSISRQAAGSPTAKLLEPESDPTWKRDPVEFLDHVEDEILPDVEFVLVVLSAGTAFVSRLSIENANHREVCEVVVHPASDQWIDVRSLGEVRYRG